MVKISLNYIIVAREVFETRYYLEVPVRHARWSCGCGVNGWRGGGGGFRLKPHIEECDSLLGFSKSIFLAQIERIQKRSSTPASSKGLSACENSNPAFVFGPEVHRRNQAAS